MAWSHAVKSVVAHALSQHPWLTVAVVFAATSTVTAVVVHHEHVYAQQQRPAQVKSVAVRPYAVVRAGTIGQVGQTGTLEQDDLTVSPFVYAAVTLPNQRRLNQVPDPLVAPEPVELLLEVHINQEVMPQPALFLEIEPGNMLLARGADINSWRLYLPSSPPYKYEGQDFYPLQDISGLKYTLDMANQRVDITVPAAALQGAVVDGFQNENPTPQHAAFGAFLNYGLDAYHGAGTNNADAFLEAGIFNSWGVLTNTMLGNNLTGNGASFATATGSTTHKWVRLETTFTQDHPETATTLKVGDAITNGGMTGLPVRFGGIQYGTNFATQPYLVTFPLPSFQGQAALPSTVNLYVNGVLQRSQQIQPGSFSIPDVPTVTGPGVVTIAVQNTLGQEQIVSLPFYASTELLKMGLNDYSFSVGSLRNNFGLVSNDYGPGLGTAVFRHGFSDSVTGEVRAESTSGEQALSLGGSYGSNALGVLSGSVATSHSSTLGSGILGELGLQRSGGIFSFGFDARVTNSHFTELGYLGMAAPQRQATANVSLALGRSGDVSVAYVNEYVPLIGQQQIVTGTYSVNAGDHGFFSLTAYRILTGQPQSGVIAMYTLPFGERSSASMGVSRNSGTTHAFVQAQENLPSGTGMGYNVGTQLGPDPQTQGAVEYQNDSGIYTLGGFHSAGSTLYQATATGGIGYIGGDWFTARYIPGSFALVRVPGFPNVPVYDNNLQVARTDGKGDAILPNLVPYAHNSVSINPSDLPYDAQSDTYTLDAVPYYRSGVVVSFPVKSVKAASFILRQENGEAVPAGALLTLSGQTGGFPVGYDGQAYVTGFAAGTQVSADWDHRHCEFTLPAATTSDAVPDLGTLVCKEVKTP